eukprot:gene13191-19024_t
MGAQLPSRNKEWMRCRAGGVELGAELDATELGGPDNRGVDVLDGNRMSTNGDWICLLEPKTGPCRASFQRYYFDFDTLQCEEFTYGGCQGNANMFESIEECLTRCDPDAVQSYVDASNGDPESVGNGPIEFRIGDASDDGLVIEDILRGNLAPAMPSLVQPPETVIENGAPTVVEKGDLTVVENGDSTSRPDPAVTEEELIDEDEDETDFLVLPDSPLSTDPTASPQAGDDLTGGGAVVSDPNAEYEAGELPTDRAGQEAENGQGEDDLLQIQAPVPQPNLQPPQELSNVGNSAHTLGCTVYATLLLSFTLVATQLFLF